MKLTRAVLILVVLLAILVAVIWLLMSFVGLQASLLWTAIIGAVAWAVRSSIERKQEYQRLLAEQKREHYLEFLDFLNRFVGCADASRHSADGAVVEPRSTTISPDEFRKWSLRLTLIGSDEVLRAWNAARLAPPDGTSANQSADMLRGWGRLWLEAIPKPDICGVRTMLHADIHG